mgnify:CR=1 FL=1
MIDKQPRETLTEHINGLSDNSIVLQACENIAQPGWLWDGPVPDALSEPTLIDALYHIETCCYTVLTTDPNTGDDIEDKDNDADLGESNWSYSILTDLIETFRENDKNEWAEELEKVLEIKILEGHTI